MCLRVSYKINTKKTNFLHPYCHLRKESDPELHPLVRDTYPRIRILAKMSQISNTDFKDLKVSLPPTATNLIKPTQPALIVKNKLFAL
jgi:hypothetical protein